MSREVIVKCNRCKKIVETPHPDRISIYKHSLEEYEDYRHNKHVRSVYKAEKPIHFCKKCTELFNSFMKNE